MLHSPFDDIEPRESKKAKKDKDKEEGKKSQSKATKYVFLKTPSCLTLTLILRQTLSYLTLTQTLRTCEDLLFVFTRNFSLLSFGEEAEEEEEMVNQVSQVTTDTNLTDRNIRVMGMLY